MSPEEFGKAICLDGPTASRVEEDRCHWHTSEETASLRKRAPIRTEGWARVSRQLDDVVVGQRLRRKGNRAIGTVHWPTRAPVEARRRIRDIRGPAANPRWHGTALHGRTACSRRSLRELLGRVGVVAYLSARFAAPQRGSPPVASKPALVSAASSASSGSSTFPKLKHDLPCIRRRSSGEIPSSSDGST